MRGTASRAILVLAVAGLLGAGCGSSAKSSTAPSTSQQLAADNALAKKAVLTATDLPAGYTGKPHVDSSDSDLPAPVQQKFLACTHLPKRFVDDKSDDQPNADSPDFAKGEITSGPASEIDSSVEIDRSTKDISEPMAFLEKDSTAQCFEPFFRAALEAGLKGQAGVAVTDVTVKSVSPGSAGDEGAGFQGRATITGPAASIPVSFDLFFVRSGRSAVTLTGIGFRKPLPLDLEHDLLAKMVGRLKTTTT